MDESFMDESFMDESFMDEIFMCDGLDCKLFAYPLQAAIYGTVTSANSALWQLAALALAIRFLNTKAHWVRPFKNRIFCFYVIHQTALIVGLYLSQTTPFSLTPHIFNRVLEPLTVSLFMLAVCEISYRCGLRWRLLGKTLGIR